MNKKKKIIMIGVAIIVIIALIVLMAVEMGKSHRVQDNKTTTKEEVTAQVTGETVTKETETKKSRKNKKDKKNKNNDKETDYWDKVQVIEGGDEVETRTYENGEVATKKDGTVDDGWSPVVSPDDLEK